MTQGLSHFQKKHESTFLDNKKIEIGYPNRVADLSNILHTQLLLHRMVYPLLWLCFDVYVQKCIYSMSAGSFPSLPPHFPLGAIGVQEL